MTFLAEYSDPFDSEHPELWVKIEHLGRYYYVLSQIDKISSLPFSIIDAGCGIGYGVEILARSSKQVLGFDIHSELISSCKEKYSLPNVAFMEMDLEKIAVKQLKNVISSPCYIITAFECLEHIDNPDMAVKAFREMLERGGYVFCSVPNQKYEKLTSKGEFYNHFHKQLFSKEKLIHLFQENGFAIEKVLGQPMVNMYLKKESTFWKSKLLPVRSAQMPMLHQPDVITYLSLLLGLPEEDPEEIGYSLIIVAKKV